MNLEKYLNVSPEVKAAIDAASRSLRWNPPSFHMACPTRRMWKLP